MNEKHNCQALLESLSDYVDGALGNELCDEIERHMTGCNDCRVVVDTLKKTVYLYHETSALTKISADVRERLFRRLDLDDFIQR